MRSITVCTDHSAGIRESTGRCILHVLFQHWYSSSDAGIWLCDSFFGKRFTGLVLKAGSILIVVMGLSMVTQGTALAGLNSRQISRMADTGSQKTGDTAVEKNGTQYVYSQLQSGKYPDITVRAGEPVEWEIEASEDNINGCNYKIFLQDFGLEHTFTEGKNIIKFTPEQAGTYTYTCWMGMITGKIHVENN